MNEEEEIVRYILAQMSKEEKSDFESRLANDGMLRYQLEHSKRLVKMFDEETEAFENMVRDVIGRRRRKSTNRYVYTFAALFILLVSSVPIYHLLFVPDPLTLASRYIEPYPDVFTHRSTDSTKLDLNAYNLGDYRSAVNKLTQRYARDQDPISGLYLAVSYLLLDDSKNALKVLETIPDQQTILINDINWYKGLALVKQQKFEDAKRIFSQIDDPVYFEKRDEILKSLK